jgi:TolA-binding protein
MKRYLYALVILVPLGLYGFSQERELYSQAQSRYLSNNYSAAYETFDEIVRNYPMSDLVPDAQYWKAVSLYRMGRLEEAIELFELVERRYRATRFIDFVDFWKGVALFQLGSFEDAHRHLVSFLERSDTTELTLEALLYRAMAEVNLGRFPQALDTMERLRAAKGDESLSPYETVLFSYVLLNLDRYEEFLAFTDGVDIERFPPAWRERIILFRAEAYLRYGRLEEAEIDYRRLIDADVELAAVALRRLYYIASLEQDVSRMEWVVQHAEDRLRTYPDILQEFWLRTGIERYRRAEYDLAEYFLSKVWNLKVTESIPEAVPLYLAQIYMRQGRRDEARRIMEEYLSSIDEQNKAVVSSFSLGTIYLNEGDYEGASNQFRRAVDLDPTGGLALNARYLLAYTSYRRDLLEEALLQCHDILSQIDGTSGDLENGLTAGERELAANVTRLKARVLQGLDRREEALRHLEDFAAANPDEARVRLDLVKLRFSTERFEAVAREGESILEDNPLLASEDPYTYVLVLYMRGLAEVSLKRYREAEESLTGIDSRMAREVGLEAIIPYVAYYRAWVRYRMNDLRAAIELTDRFLSGHRGHPLYAGALYLGGWSRYSMGEYGEAEKLFSRLASLQAGDLSNKALFFKGQSQKNLDRDDEAAATFSTLYTRYPDSPFADDALFEHADILRGQGRLAGAAEQYHRVWKSYPSSPLAEEALYLRGELYFDEERYGDARSAFREYRVQFPEGDMVDGSLYWEGVASQRMGEDRVSVMLWEEVVGGYRNSAFRPDAMRGSAEAYVRFGEYSRAYNLYTDLIRSYPEYSSGVRAETRLEEIRYLRFGLGEREAELTARISRSGGAETPEGREAMVELSRLYIYEEEGKLERAYQILNQVMREDDPGTAAEAGVLLGEYYYRQGDKERAAREFIQASLRNPDDRDLMAYAIFRAAQSMKEAGNLREARELVKRLRENFPSSSWADEGEKLLEGADE